MDRSGYGTIPSVAKGWALAADISCGDENEGSHSVWLMTDNTSAQPGNTADEMQFVK